MIPRFSYVRARSLGEAVERLSGPGAVLHAGGTDLLGCLRDKVFSAHMVVSISRVGNLRGITEIPHGGLRIGALTTVAEISEHPLVTDRYPVLAQAAAQVASPQLRNQGTIGGNICQKPRCWYYRGEFHCRRKGGGACYAFDGENQFHAIFGSDNVCCMVHPSDLAPALIALDAGVRIVGPSGTRDVPVGNFFVLPRDDVERETVVEPGEVIVEILVPGTAPGLRSSYRKVRVRRSWDFALAGVALALSFDGDRVERSRVVFSGVAPIPWRSVEVEKVLTGDRLDSATITRAARVAVAGAQPLKHNGYKIHLLRGIVEEQLAELAKSS